MCIYIYIHKMYLYIYIYMIFPSPRLFGASVPMNPPKIFAAIVFGKIIPINFMSNKNM